MVEDTHTGAGTGRGAANVEAAAGSGATFRARGSGARGRRSKGNSTCLRISSRPVSRNVAPHLICNVNFSRLPCHPSLSFFHPNDSPCTNRAARRACNLHNLCVKGHPSRRLFNRYKCEPSHRMINCTFHNRISPICPGFFFPLGFPRPPNNGGSARLFAQLSQRLGLFKHFA